MNETLGIFMRSYIQCIKIRAFEIHQYERSDIGRIFSSRKGRKEKKEGFSNKVLDKEGWMMIYMNREAYVFHRKTYIIMS